MSASSHSKTCDNQKATIEQKHFKGDVPIRVRRNTAPVSRKHRQEITAPALKTTTNPNPKTASNRLQLPPCS